MKQKNSISLITIFLSILIILLLVLIIFFAIYVYNEEFLNEERDIVSINSVDKIENVITAKLPEEDEEVEIISIAPSSENQIDVSEKENTDKFYYNQLDKNSKLIYGSLNNNKGNLKTGNAIIDLPQEIEELLKNEEEISNIEMIFSSAVNAFEYDNPDIFYLDFSKVVLYYENDSLGNCNAYIKCNNENSNYFIEIFDSKEDINKAEEQIQIIIEKLKNETNNLLNDYDKIKYIHDWIVKNTKYDETLSEINRNNIYGLLIEKNATCGGYAKVFKYLMDKLNINSIIVQGKAEQQGKSEYHAWNYVQLNKSWYVIDCTWDDPIIDGVANDKDKPIYYDYFLKGKNSFDTHIRLDTFYGTDLKINYPELSQNDY